MLPEVKRRLDIVRYEFDFLKHLALVINAWRNHQAMNDAAFAHQLLDAVDARNAFIAEAWSMATQVSEEKEPRLSLSSTKRA